MTTTLSPNLISLRAAASHLNNGAYLFRVSGMQCVSHLVVCFCGHGNAVAACMRISACVFCVDGGFSRQTGATGGAAYARCCGACAGVPRAWRDTSALFARATTGVGASIGIWLAHSMQRLPLRCGAALPTRAGCARFKAAKATYNDIFLKLVAPKIV